MSMKNKWMDGNPFNWRGRRTTPVTPHYRDREPGSLGENHKFPPDFLEIFGLPPYNRRLLEAGATTADRAKAHIDYTTEWRDYIKIVEIADFAPFEHELDGRYEAAIEGVLSDYMDVSGNLIYRIWTGSAKKQSIYKVAFPNAPIFNTTMLTPVPFHCVLAKLLGSDDNENHRRAAAENVVSEYQKLLIMSGVYVPNLIKLLAGSHIGGINNRLGSEKAAMDAAEREARKVAIAEAGSAAGAPKSLNELLGWTDN